MVHAPSRGPRRPALLLGALSCLLLSGQPLAAQAPTGPALVPEALAALERDVQRELERRVQAASATPTALPGVTAALRLPDGRTLAFAAGRADLERDVTMRTDQRMPAGSVGKTFVAAVAMSLVEEGRLSLDAPVARWLGHEAWFERLPNHETLTLRHLLNHSGGLIDHVFDDGSGFTDWFARTLDVSGNARPRSESAQRAADLAFDPATLVTFALDREPLFRAGEGFRYTDTGYVLVGLIIEEATGRPYHELLAERLLGPLGLTLTAPLNHRLVDDLAQGYAVESHGPLGLPERVMTNGRLVFNPRIEWTGGGIVSNPQDLVRWMAALFESGAVSAASRREMLTSIGGAGAGRDPAGRPLGYGLGIGIVETDAGTAYRHGGFFPGYVSMAAYFPDHRIAIAVQVNSDGAALEAHVDAVRDIVFAALGITH